MRDHERRPHPIIPAAAAMLWRVTHRRLRAIRRRGAGWGRPVGPRPRDWPSDVGGCRAQRGRARVPQVRCRNIEFSLHAAPLDERPELSPGFQERPLHVVTWRLRHPLGRGARLGPADPLEAGRPSTRNVTDGLRRHEAAKAGLRQSVDAGLDRQRTDRPLATGNLAGEDDGVRMLATVATCSAWASGSSAKPLTSDTSS